MVREIAVFLYLRLFAILFYVFRLFPLQKDKIVFVVSFTENSSYIYKEMKRQEISCRTVFLATNKMHPYFSKHKDATTYKFEPSNFKDFILSSYHLATAKIIFVDNYFGFLATCSFKKEVECIQLWHANGALKKFGLEDASVPSRTKIAQKRFKKVYSKFDKVIVGSEEMAEIFKKAFGINESKILRTGIPRTDLFYDTKRHQHVKNKYLLNNPEFRNKKVILYAPTFRDTSIHSFQMPLNLDMMKDVLGQEYILILKLHPAIKQGVKIKETLKDFVYDFSDCKNINELFFISDLLITDYSSIPFEYCILNKPMIFFPYDLKDYSKTRGFWEDYESFVPGPVVYTTSQLVNVICKITLNSSRCEEFNKKWNRYSTGNSSNNIVKYIQNHIGSTNDIT
ncbi:CDP-glycerol glycerophosphotransferase family protein [Bacillus massilinigeriensis]|uniref:CDP-glycerol glycerophosphotransferase family protein n=1 Tax=Bacillus mediterraneensis TaxID=1805474 RepID=UPI0008F8A285|nr:CDP-glycerol glycerophosphotransferase family protein [Bacillus mediterraneensis]